MGSPFNQFTQSFFSSTGDGSLNPDAFSEETRSAAVNANDASAKETAENMRFNYIHQLLCIFHFSLHKYRYYIIRHFIL